MPSAVLFDNSGEFYTRSVTNPGGYSMVMWIKRSSDQAHGPFAYGSTNAGGATLFITRSGGQLKLLDLGSTSIGGLSMSDNTWYCIGLTVSSGGDANYYYGSDPGSLTTASASGVQNPTGTQTFSIGDDSFSGDWWRGSIAAVKIWTGTVLTSVQVAAELGQYAPIVSSGLFGYYPFSSGPSITDVSGNGHDLTGGTGASEDTSGPPIPLGGGVSGTIAAGLGALTASVAGTRTTSGSVACSLGALTAHVTGTRTTPGSVAASLGALTAHVTGTRTTPGSVAASLGALTAHVTGIRSTSGTVSCSLGALTATVRQQGAVSGAISASLGALTVRVVQLVETVVAGDSSGWWKLAALYRQKAPPAPELACPRCGWPLREARGVRYCPHGDYRSRS